MTKIMLHKWRMYYRAVLALTISSCTGGSKKELHKLTETVWTTRASAYWATRAAFEKRMKASCGARNEGATRSRKMGGKR